MIEMGRTSLAQQCRDFTIAAYSLGYAIEVSEKLEDLAEWRDFADYRYRCTWRRAGPLGSGEYRELRVTWEFLEYAHEPFRILLDQLARPLVGDEILTKVFTAHAQLETNKRDGSVPVEFIGGPRDGEVLTLPTGRDGFPRHDLWLVALTEPIKWTREIAPTDTVSTTRLRYERAALDEERGVWRFAFAGTH